MNHKPLSETNPYLRDKSTYEKSLFVNVSSSITIELGTMPESIKKALKEKNKTIIYLSPEIEKDLSQ